MAGELSPEEKITKQKLAFFSVLKQADVEEDDAAGLLPPPLHR